MHKKTLDILDKTQILYGWNLDFIDNYQKVMLYFRQK